MTITLPDEMRAELESRAKAAGFASVDEYIADRLRADEVPVSLPEPLAGARYAVRTREELEAKLLEGMNRDGDVVADAEFWERRRASAEERAGRGEPQ